jgi:hypothetical protein
MEVSCSLCGPCCRLCLLQSSLTIRLQPEPAAWEVIPIKVLAGSIVREANLEGSAVRDGLVFDDADDAQSASSPPEVLEPIGRQLGVTNRVLNVLVTEVGLQGAKNLAARSE